MFDIGYQSSALSLIFSVIRKPYLFLWLLFFLIVFIYCLFLFCVCCCFCFVFRSYQYSWERCFSSISVELSIHTYKCNVCYSLFLSKPLVWYIVFPPHFILSWVWNKIRLMKLHGASIQKNYSKLKKSCHVDICRHFYWLEIMYGSTSACHCIYLLIISKDTYWG